MKKVLTILLAAVLAVCLCAGASAQTELTVFAAASLTETLNEIKGVYETANPEVTLIFLGHIEDADRGGRGLRRVHLRGPEADEPAGHRRR